jgi:hypothetical protein
MTDRSAQTEIAIHGDLSFLINDTNEGGGEFPTRRIQKGLVLARGATDLSEEGVGFGIPVVKYGHDALFPGTMRLTIEEDDHSIVLSAEYEMNLIERVVLRGDRRLENRAFYQIKEHIAGLHRKYPALRGVVESANSFLRKRFGISNWFEKVASVGAVSVVYTIRPEKGTIHVHVDTSSVHREKCTEMIIMNEQGASHFDYYRDSNGTLLSGEAIGTWEETFADEASLIDRRDRIAFTLQKEKGSKMFRGRELIAGRLAWAGIAYVIPPYTVDFDYRIKVGGIKLD